MTFLQKIGKLKYVEQGGFFVHINSHEFYMLYATDNPFKYSILRSIVIVDVDYEFVDKYEFLMVSDRKIIGSETESEFRNYLKILYFDDETVDFIIDNYRIHSEHRVSKFDQETLKNLQNKQKKRSNFFTFCRKLLKG